MELTCRTRSLTMDLRTAAVPSNWPPLGWPGRNPGRLGSADQRTSWVAAPFVGGNFGRVSTFAASHALGTGNRVAKDLLKTDCPIAATRDPPVACMTSRI
jgi:hypothetical protein